MSLIQPTQDVTYMNHELIVTQSKRRLLYLLKKYCPQDNFVL